MWTAPQLVQYGYFYDALSGGFLPPSDPKKETHTLARLLGSTFDNGEVTNPSSAYELRTYKPVWAPISSVVHVSNNDFIRSLDMRGEEDALRVVHTLKGKDGFRTLQVFTGDLVDPVFVTPLVGSGYSKIQNTVAEIAQEFFDTFPAPQA